LDIAQRHPASSAAVMNACLSVWGVTALGIPARRAVLRTIRPVPCRSSAFLLAGDDTMTIRDLFGATAAQARLGVLVGCETGVAGSSLPDEALGLPTALLAAGVTGVIASAWAIHTGGDQRRREVPEGRGQNPGRIGQVRADGEAFGRQAGIPAARWVLAHGGGHDRDRAAVVGRDQAVMAAAARALQRGRADLTASLHQLTCLTSARFRARAPGPVSGQLCHAPGRALGKTARVSCCLSAAGLRFLGILSRPGVPPLLRSAYRASKRGPERGFHVPHA
jgi:hypothetical protein